MYTSFDGSADRQKRQGRVSTASICTRTYAVQSSNILREKRGRGEGEERGDEEERDDRRKKEERDKKRGEVRIEEDKRMDSYILCVHRNVSAVKKPIKQTYLHYTLQNSNQYHNRKLNDNKV